MRRPLALLPLACLALAAGCIDVPSEPSPASVADPLDAPRLFSEPVVLTSEGAGFEPSIDAGPDGTLYAAAAKTNRPNEGARLASWLWYSTDGGATWQDLPSPAGAHRLMFGFEGDTAVDAQGRFYFADTHLPDDAIHRWSPGAQGPAWDWSRPVMGTTAVLDDRPWLSAHGDGVVYLLSNNGPAVPSAGDLLEGEVAPERIHLFVSTDGGLTWSLGHAFPRSGFCQVAASPADDQTVTVACDEGSGPGTTMTVWRSEDRGATWTDVFASQRVLGTGYLTASVAMDQGGASYVAWLDERVDWSGMQDVAWAGEEPARVHVARATAGGGWESFDVTPFPGRFGMIHACAYGAGRAAVVFYGATDLTVTDETEWRAYALLSEDADAAQPTWTLSPMVDHAVAKASVPPRDLFECAVGPDGAVHAVVQDETDPPGDGRPSDGIRAHVLYVRTPPLSGAP